MARNKALAVVALTLLLVLMLGGLADVAHADYTQREGVGGLFEGRGLDEDKTPDRWQVWLGIGSIFVMIAVVKWL